MRRAPSVAVRIFALAASVAGLVWAAAAPAETIHFLTQYENTTIANHDPNGGPHAFVYSSGLIGFPEVEGDRLAFVRVALFDLGVEPTVEATTAAPPSELLDGFFVTAEIVDPGGNLPIPVERVGDALEGSMMEVPATALGVELTVESPDPGLEFYTSVAADVSLGFGEALGFLAGEVGALRANLLVTLPPGQDRAEALRAANEARSALARAQAIYNADHQKAKQAEEFADQARAAFEKGDVAGATRGLRKANAKIKEAQDSLQEAANELAGSVFELAGLPGTAALIAELNQQIGQLLASKVIVGAHYALYEITFTNTAAVTVDVGSTGTFYDQSGMKVHCNHENSRDPSVVAHEYGHAVFQKKTGNTLPAGPHSVNGATTAALAWSEGFATFFGQWALRNDTYVDSTGPTGPTGFTNDLESRTANGMGIPDGDTIEGNVSALLWDIVDGANTSLGDSDSDGLSVGFSVVWKCICDDMPTTTAAFLACLEKQLTDAQKAALASVKMRNGIP